MGTEATFCKAGFGLSLTGTVLSSATLLALFRNRILNRGLCIALISLECCDLLFMLCAMGHCSSVLFRDKQPVPSSIECKAFISGLFLFYDVGVACTVSFAFARLMAVFAKFKYIQFSSSSKNWVVVVFLQWLTSVCICGVTLSGGFSSTHECSFFAVLDRKGSFVQSAFAFTASTVVGVSYITIWKKIGATTGAAKLHVHAMSKTENLEATVAASLNMFFCVIYLPLGCYFFYLGYSRNARTQIVNNATLMPMIMHLVNPFIFFWRISAAPKQACCSRGRQQALELLDVGSPQTSKISSYSQNPGISLCCGSGERPDVSRGRSLTPSLRVFTRSQSLPPRYLDTHAAPAALSQTSIQLQERGPGLQLWVDAANQVSIKNGQSTDVDFGGEKEKAGTGSPEGAVHRYLVTSRTPSLISAPSQERTRALQTPAVWETIVYGMRWLSIKRQLDSEEHPNVVVEYSEEDETPKAGSPEATKPAAELEALRTPNLVLPLPSTQPHRKRSTAVDQQQSAENADEEGTATAGPSGPLSTLEPEADQRADFGHEMCSSFLNLLLGRLDVDTSTDVDFCAACSLDKNGTLGRKHVRADAAGHLQSTEQIDENKTDDGGRTDTKESTERADESKTPMATEQTRILIRVTSEPLEESLQSQHEDGIEVFKTKSDISSSGATGKKKKPRKMHDDAERKESGKKDRRSKAAERKACKVKT